ncbi:MAG: efflux RND transporter permease subunit [Rubinisphaera brasiliensis]|uniref:efflux RND transporter permease subunit n=1 Tax=Rubinisphaera brasiliensis TaxID=119 RepID=UPI00391A89BF
MIATMLYRRPRLLIVAVLLITAAGLNAFFALPRLEDPVLRKRVGIATVRCPGLNADEIDQQVALPLSTGVAEIAEIKQTRTASRPHVCSMMIELADEVTAVEPVWSLVREQLQQTISQFPHEAQHPGLEVLPIKASAAVVAIRPREGKQADPALIRSFLRELEDRLQAVPGTESISVYGNTPPTISVQISVEKLLETGLTPAGVAEQLRSYTTGGFSETTTISGENAAISIPAELTSFASLPNQLIQLPDGSGIPLASLASITREFDTEIDELSLVDGTSTSVLAVNVQDGQRLDVWHPRFEESLAEFRSLLPESLTVELLFAQQPFVRARLLNLAQNFLIAAAAVLLVTLLMMGSRSALVVATALPLAVLISLFAMWVLAIPIQQISVTGLVIALGLLIDNAIVVVEDFRARHAARDSPAEAISHTVGHLGMPLFASTMTTTVAFLPIALLPGPSGEFVSSMAVSVILAINASLVISLTLIPAILALWVQNSPSSRRVFAGVRSRYFARGFQYTLGLAMRFPWLVLIVVAPITALGYTWLPQLPKQFFPPSDRHQIVLELELPAGTSLNETAEAANHLRELVIDQPEVNRVHWFVGQSAPTFYYNVIPSRRNAPNYAQGWADVSSGTDVNELARKLQLDLRNRFPEGRVLARPLGQGPPIEAPVEVELQGPDWTELQSLANELRRICSQVPAIIYTSSSVGETLAHVDFDIDEAAASQSGISSEAIIQQLITLPNGADAGQLFELGEGIPVRVSIPADERSTLQQMLDMPAWKTESDPALPRNAPNRFVPLAEVVETGWSASPALRVRSDGRKIATIQAYIAPGTLAADVQEQLEKQLQIAGFSVPPGYSAAFRGETAARSSAIRDLTTHIVWLAGLAAASMLFAFRSFRMVFVVAGVAAISFSICPLVLAANQLPLGFMAILGGMGLMGIAVNDAIVVVAALQSCSDEREARVQAVAGCARHVLTTTLTTIAGFVPLILYGGDFWQPLAITISCGVAMATVLSLYVVPSAYAMLMPANSASNAPPALTTAT